MWNVPKTPIKISPFFFFLIVLFILLGDSTLLLALGVAGTIHELAHLLLIDATGGTIKQFNFTPLGAEMETGGEISYGREALATAAGPLSNLLCALLLSLLGKRWEGVYLFAGAQAILGIFNLLPMTALDGGSLLWICVAVLSDPYRADRICAVTGFITASLLLAGCLWLMNFTKSIFPLLAAIVLFVQAGREIGLVKRKRKR